MPEGELSSRPVRPTVTHSTMSGGYGGSGGAAGGMARSVLELRTSTSVHCTVTTSITSFGDYLSATAGIWNTPGAGTGGTDFVTTGNEGGQGGRGGRREGETGTAGSKSYPARGNDGKGNGGQGGAARVSSSNFDINNVGRRWRWRRWNICFTKQHLLRRPAVYHLHSKRFEKLQGR